MSNRILRAASGILSPLGKPIYRYIHLGDSLTQGSTAAFSANFGGWDLTWQVAMASNGALLPVRNAGVAGQASPRITARVVRDVLKWAPDVVGVTMGTNDVIGLNSSANIAGNLAAVHAVLKSAGVFFYFTTIPPYAARAALVDTVNGIIRDFCTTNGVPLVDFYAEVNDPANPGNWLANYSSDGIHPLARVSWLWAQAAWTTLSPSLTSTRKHQRPRVLDASNLLFPSGGVNAQGLPNTATNIDGLFNNYRTYAAGGYSLPLPYLWNNVYTSSGTAPTASGAISQVADVAGNLHTLTAAPNGAGAVTATAILSGLGHYQGRRMRLSWLMGLAGFDAQNTNAALAAGGSLRAYVGLKATCRDNNSAAIGSITYTDPVDPGASLWDGASLALSTNWSANVDLLSYDLSRRPMNFEFNVAPGTESIYIELTVTFSAAASGSVTIEHGEYALVDVGPAQFPMLVAEASDFTCYRTFSAAAAMTGGTAIKTRYFRCNATSAAFTVTLPAANLCRGVMLQFKKVDGTANAVTIAANGAETIDGAGTYGLATQYKHVRLMSNGVSWDILAAG